MVIDSHCHVSDCWYEPVESLLQQMDHHGVERALLIQMLGQTDNSYQQKMASRYADRLASVVTVDVSHMDAVSHLERLVSQGAVGVRLRPGDSSLGEDPLAIWRAADRLGIFVSCVGNSQSFLSPILESAIRCFPSLRIVLEHLGSSSAPDADAAASASRRLVFGLSQYANVWIKLPGLGELLSRPTLMARHIQTDRHGDADHDLILAALQSFGADRIVWGSDFPVVSSREGYGNALNWCRDLVMRLQPQAVPSIFGGNAQSLWIRR